MSYDIYCPFCKIQMESKYCRDLEYYSEPQLKMYNVSDCLFSTEEQKQ